MSKHAARAERMALALQAGLDEMKEGPTSLAVATWCEADGDAGYLVHTDGRMMPMGDYQHGFSSVKEMVEAATADTENGLSARTEIGMVATYMEPLCNEELKEEILERIGYAFIGENDSNLVAQAVSDGMTIEQVFDLYTSRPDSRAIMHAGYAIHEMTLERDIQVAMLKQTTEGPAWVIETVARNGDKVKGDANAQAGMQNNQGYACIEHPLIGELSVVLNEGDIAPHPVPLRSNTCSGHRP